MKKILIVSLCLILSSCGLNNKNIEEDKLGNPINIEDYVYVGTFKNDEDIYIQPYRHNMQDAAWRMILVRDGNVIKLFDESITKPKFNKDRTKILYVNPFEFEAVGNVTIYDSRKKKEIVYTDLAYDTNPDTVKDVEWVTAEVVLCIIGYSTGTITQGGKAYQLNLETKDLIEIIPEEKIKEWTDRPNEIVDIYIEEKHLEITLVEWCDDNYNEYCYTVHNISLEDANIEIE